jgi:hypothetical protein
MSGKSSWWTKLETKRERRREGEKEIEGDMVNGCAMD